MNSDLTNAQVNALRGAVKTEPAVTMRVDWRDCAAPDACKCQTQMGMDFYFLPQGSCLFMDDK
jgi:hypothetical protein